MYIPRHQDWRRKVRIPQLAWTFRFDAVTVTVVPLRVAPTFTQRTASASISLVYGDTEVVETSSL
jgi:hypothetical protein